MDYIDELKRLYPSRPVRALIVSGREDQVAATRLTQISGYDIRWLCYHVQFQQMSATASAALTS